jgi:AcrR family transcriptional regulator
MSLFAERARAQMRETALDVLADFVSGGEPTVAMAAVARRVGVSRQTLYAEFGSREAMLTALVDRENAVLLRLVIETLDSSGDDLVEAVGAAAEAALHSAAGDVLHKALLAGDVATVGVVVGRGEPLLQRAHSQLAEFLLVRFPMLDPADTVLLVDVVVRVVQSHIVWPQEAAEVTGARIRRLVHRYLAGGPDGADRVVRRVEPTDIPAPPASSVFPSTDLEVHP